MNYLAYSNKIVVFLSFDEFDKSHSYSFNLDGKLCFEGNKTNYTFEHLDNGKTYKISVFDGKNVIFDEEITTLKEKYKIIVKVSDNEGKDVVTKEVQAYLDLAGPNNMIVFPKGIYRCGALFIHSDTEIYLEKDAMILGSVRALDYLPKIPSRFEGYEVKAYASLINIGHLNHNEGASTHNVLIHGEGTIYGGDRELRKDMLALEADYPVINDRFRNRLINISNSSNVIIDGLHVGKSASWNIHPIYSDHIYIHHCDFKSGGLPNGDGIDPDSSHDLFIFANTFFVGDDCVAIKSGKNPEGNIINIPCYNVYVFDCLSLGSHGCAIGSEISGGVHDVDIYDCDFAKSIFGLHIKTTLKRGSYVKNVRVKHCKVSSIYIHSVDYNDDGDSASSVTEFSNYDFKDITITGDPVGPDGRTYDMHNILVDGFKDYLTFKDMTFDDIKIIKDKGIVINNASNCLVKEVKKYEE